MSLIEVVVAVVILAMMSTAVLGVILKTQSAGVSNRSRIAAANLAAREIDLVRDEFGRSTPGPAGIAAAGTQTNPHPLDGQTLGQPLVVDGTGYVVVRSVAWNVTGTGTSACNGGSLVVYPTLGVAVSVTWPNMGSVAPVAARATLAPAKGDGVPGTDSFVAVKVVDSAAAPSVGRTVAVTGSGVTTTGTTDASGCAVVEVSPATGLGTVYSAQVTDSGYVDISGTTGPTKSVGQLAQGRLNNALNFAYDRAATLRLHLVDSSGTPVDDATVVGSQVTLVPSESGATEPPVMVTGAITTVTGLWPSKYGAYYGTTAPPAGFDSVDVAPGASVDLNVSVQMATASFAAWPAGTTSVIAVPGTATACPSGARAIASSAFGGFSAFPGTWSFFATGPTFDCAPGPSVPLAPGANDPVTWLGTTLQVTNAPAGSLWAVNLSKVPGGMLTTCPGSAYASVAVPVSGVTAIPAGTWYVYATAGAADAACLGVPGGLYPVVLGYGAPNVIAWVVPTATLTVTGVSKDRVVIFSTSTVSNCTASAYTTSGTSQVAGPAPSTGSSLYTTVNRPPSGTQIWYVYVWKKTSTIGCTATGTFVVGTATVALQKPQGSTTDVGPTQP